VPSTPRIAAPPPAAGSPCDGLPAVVEVDPASTLDFRPTRCRLDLAGWYALRVAYGGAPVGALFLFCEAPGDDEESLAIRYVGSPVTGAPLTELVDPYTDGDDLDTVSYAFGAPRAPARYRFEGGVVRFDRPPRPVLAVRDGEAHVELGLDLRFEGGRRWRAALRVCPTYAATGPVSDPID
jgi:hypothetical protein